MYFRIDGCKGENMARIPARLIVFSLLFASPAMAQSSWLHPYEREYQYAIDAVFGQAKAGPDDAQALEFIRRLPDNTKSYVSVRPPLACANLHAEERKREFAHAPTVDRLLLVAVRYFFAPLELDRSLVI